MRIFKTKAFARLARHHDVVDSSLIKAVDDAARGLVEADLGGGIIKQRVARRGAGKSGGFRVILAFHSETRSVFMYLFAKSDQDNIDDNQLISFRELARVWLKATDDAIDKARTDGKLLEVQREKSSGENQSGAGDKAKGRKGVGKSA